MNMLDEPAEDWDDESPRRRPKAVKPTQADLWWMVAMSFDKLCGVAFQLIAQSVVWGGLLALAWNWFLVPVLEWPKLTWLQGAGLELVLTVGTCAMMEFDGKNKRGSLGHKLVLIPGMLLIYMYLLHLLY